MKHPFPLYLKILLWFFLNLVVLAVIGFFIFAGRFGIDLLVSGPVATRMSAVSEATTAEFRTRPRSEWNLVLENHSRTYGVKFLLFRDDGTQLAGEPTALPDEVKQNLRGPPGRPGPDGRASCVASSRRLATGVPRADVSSVAEQNHAVGDPGDCFLIATAYLAARLYVTPASLVTALAGDKKLRARLRPVRYYGVLSEFAGERWWRGSGHRDRETGAWPDSGPDRTSLR